MRRRRATPRAPPAWWPVWTASSTICTRRERATRPFDHRQPVPRLPVRTRRPQNRRQPVPRLPLRRRRFRRHAKCSDGTPVAVARPPTGGRGRALRGVRPGEGVVSRAATKRALRCPWRAPPPPCYTPAMADAEVGANLTIPELHDLVARGEIDTVLTVLPDLYGRLVGKRIAGRYFCDEVLAHGMHVCDYLLACDMEMDP